MAKTIINARVIDQALLLGNLPTLASGGVKEIQVKFSFCDLWAGAAKKTAVFFRDPVAVYHAELTDDACLAPWEAFAVPGTVHMGVFAEYEDGTTRTCEALPLTVAQGAITTQTAAPNAPNIYAALEARVRALEAGGSASGGSAAAMLGEVTLYANKWAGENNLYSQVVTISGVTENSQVDLTPSVEQLAIFYNKDLAFVTENEDGVVTVYAIGQKPENDYTIQVTITEVLA